MPVSQLNCSIGMSGHLSGSRCPYPQTSQEEKKEDRRNGNRKRGRPDDWGKYREVEDTEKKSISRVSIAHTNTRLIVTLYTYTSYLRPDPLPTLNFTLTLRNDMYLLIYFQRRNTTYPFLFLLFFFPFILQSLCSLENIRRSAAFLIRITNTLILEPNHMGNDL